MSSLADELDRGKPVPADALRDVVTFLRIFADQCHHTKEEANLFVVLENRGVSAAGCPLAAMRGEHAAGRILLGKLAAAAADYIVQPLGAKDALRDSLRRPELYQKEWVRATLSTPRDGDFTAIAGAPVV